MARLITFNELRRIKDSLPHGTIQKIADELGAGCGKELFRRRPFR